MSNPLVAIVTGANRGIGEAICQSLIKTVKQPFVLYATSRKGDTELSIPEKPSTTTIKYPKLDITSQTSIQALYSTIQTAHPSGLDVLINNAGVNLMDGGDTPSNVSTVMATNYQGTSAMCSTFLPLLKHHSVNSKSRIVNISSVASLLDEKKYSTDIISRFRSPNLTLPDLDAMMSDYQSAINDRTAVQNGWRASSYCVSKAAMNAFTRILARENEDLLINACCPGWVATGMGNMVGKPPKTAEEGARIPVRLAVGDVGGVTGRYWANGSVRSKGDGEVVDW